MNQQLAHTGIKKTNNGALLLGTGLVVASMMAALTLSPDRPPILDVPCYRLRTNTKPLRWQASQPPLWHDGQVAQSPTLIALW